VRTPPETHPRPTSDQPPAGGWSAVVSVDRLDAGDLREAIPQTPFDASLKRHGARWATDAGAVESDPDHAAFRHFDQFEVATIGLDGGTDEIDDLADLPVEITGRAGCIGVIRISLGHVPLQLDDRHGARPAEPPIIRLIAAGVVIA